VYAYTNQLGTIAATWNPTTGVIDHQYYLPYGEIRQSDGLDTAVGYTGQRHDPSGLIYYQARYYDPHVHRFTQPDTIIPSVGNGQDFNRYTYVRNNPVNYSDPTGHCGWGLPCPIDEIGEALDTVTQPLKDAAGGAGALVTDIGEFIVDTAEGTATVSAAVVGGAWERGATWTNYRYRSTLNRLEDPAQTVFDLATGNVLLSDAHAAWATATGAHISDENCVDEAVCFVGGLSIAEIGSNGKNTALGTTIHAGVGPLEPEQGLHEGQHVQDFQLLGGFGFLWLYVGEWVGRVGTPAPGGYHELWSEERARYTANTGHRGRDFGDRVAGGLSSLWPF